MTMLMVLLGGLVAGASYLHPQESQPPRLARGVMTWNPSCSLTARRGEFKKVWPISAAEAHLYEFYKGPALAEINGRWYAMNGMARERIKNHRIVVGSNEFSIGELDTLPVGSPPHLDSAASTLFLLELNDIVNDKCPT